MMVCSARKKRRRTVFLVTAVDSADSNGHIQFFSTCGTPLVELLYDSVAGSLLSVEVSLREIATLTC
jgi:hypothetical protein